MPNDYDERFQQHEEILRSLTAMLARQDVINERLTMAIEHIDRTLEQQGEINQGVRTTLARIEALLERLIHPSGNGRDA
jgi:transcriptional regulator NrdR family protein